MSTEGNRQAIRGERLKDAEVKTDERIQQYQKYSNAAVPVQQCNSSTAVVNCTHGEYSTLLQVEAVQNLDNTTTQVRDAVPGIEQHP